ncbi:hypothetical protein HDK64DRAFT_88213 [Phyllosticta capitalensis]
MLSKTDAMHVRVSTRSWCVLLLPRQLLASLPAIHPLRLPTPARHLSLSLSSPYFLRHSTSSHRNSLPLGPAAPCLGLVLSSRSTIERGGGAPYSRMHLLFSVKICVGVTTCHYDSSPRLCALEPQRPQTQLKEGTCQTSSRDVGQPQVAPVHPPASPCFRLSPLCRFQPALSVCIRKVC